MKKIKLIATISLLILATTLISSLTFAQSTKMKTLKYYVNVNLSLQDSYDQKYRIEIWDQYGWRVLAPQASVPGKHMYVFQETVPVSAPAFNRVARFIYIPVYSSVGQVLWPDPHVKPDVKSTLYRGNYSFSLYPMERNSSSGRNQKIEQQ